MDAFITADSSLCGSISRQGSLYDGIGCGNFIVQKKLSSFYGLFFMVDYSQIISVFVGT